MNLAVRFLFRQLLVCLFLVPPLLAMAADTDGDGYDDAVDAFPNDRAAAVDTDGDGMPDAYLYLLIESVESGDSFVFVAPWRIITSSGSKGWFKTSTYGTSQGGLAAASDMAGPGTSYPSRLTNKLQLSLTVSGNAQLRYDYKYSKPSDTGFFLSFKIPCDNCLYGEATVTSSWITETKTLSVGTHTLVWEHDCQSSETTRLGYKCYLAKGYAAVIDNVRVFPVTALLEDSDDDNDGVADGADLFPLDTDNDGIGNNADLDDDNDGVPDYIDAAPQNAGNANERNLLLNAPYSGSAVAEGASL